MMLVHVGIIFFVLTNSGAFWLGDISASDQGRVSNTGRTLQNKTLRWLTNQTLDSTVLHELEQIYTVVYYKDNFLINDQRHHKK